MPATRSLLLAALVPLFSVAGCKCGGTTPPPSPTGTPFALERAFTADGTKLVARFAKELDASTVQGTDFELTSDAGPVTQTIASVAVNGNEVTLTLNTALPKGPTYRVAASGLSSTAGDVVSPDPVDLLGTLYLAMVWHQHQPVYLDPSGNWEWSRGPWVRKHATKDYYDMVAMLRDFPEVHVQVNLTPVLLMQLEDFYVARLAPYVDTATKTVNKSGYFAQRPSGATEPVTDPWIDLLLQDTPAPSALTAQQKGWFYADTWSNFSISDVMVARFPDYQALRDKKNAAPDTLTQADLLNMKVWFQLAWFDPRFLRGPVTLPDGQIVDLSDLVTEQADGTFTLDAPFTEATGERLVVEEFKVLSNVVAAHKALMYDATTKQGQVEVMTTPFFHPILPLLTDTELAKQAMPTTPMPSKRFQQEADADAHVAKAVKRFTDDFGRAPTGMWPAEGSVAEAVVPIFARHGVRWLATDRRVLEKSTPANQPIYSPYRIDVDTVAGDGGTVDDELAIVFRDTELSDKIGFHYQGQPAATNVADYLASLRKHSPRYGEDRLLTVILDGENAWEWYKQDNDGIGFLEGMYGALTGAQTLGEVRTVTVSEYLDGNAARQVPAHPVHALPELEPLFAGSWISGSFSTWIGEDEENLAWDYLADVRADLAGFAAGYGFMARPDPLAAPPPEGPTAQWYAYKAWESMYAAEGSDWFWWYGADQTAVGGDGPFDRIFLTQLENVYRYAQLAGVPTPVPDLPKILRVCRPPAGPLTANPTIDGTFTPDDGRDPDVANEWTNAGSGVCQDVDSGTTPNPQDVISTWYHGVTGDSVWLALRMSQDVTPLLGTDFQVRAYFSQKHIVSVSPEQITQDPKQATTRSGDPITFSAEGAAREVSIDFSSGTPTALLATTDGTSWGTPAAAAGVAVSVSGDVIELKVPLASLNWQSGDPLELLVTANAIGTELDRAPNLNSIVLFSDRTALVEVTFVLDATGTQLALDAVKAIANPVPPKGTGKVFIVGNAADLGNWTPNSIAMSDDGATLGDQTAGDNLWTFRLSVAPGTELNYKYTMGNAGDGWSPSEEYPLTNRGFEVKDTDGDRKMILHDVFADRPDPSGTLPPRTQVIDP